MGYDFTFKALSLKRIMHKIFDVKIHKIIYIMPPKVDPYS